ncbi:MAG TPA: DNA mismatch repair endonuclease MutL [Verrucomicrobiae bacterium]|nr:DNA mismatch repair endonuclease MutL [Verrucomicrobiae bacterium]
MNRIRLLPEQVANQIAAGEVIERPASVVKELVENSLDAQAKQVSIEIQAGGRSLIRVSDDGVGMSRDDALLCLERHATSKIRRVEDLDAIVTMGFRGEALPSIASVSRFTLITREHEPESVEGSRIVISGGKILEVKVAGAAPGTIMEVRQIFFNVPARRKFLRSDETESAHIQHYLTLAALAYPEVSFTFQKDGRIIWQLPAIQFGADPDGRLAAVGERLRAIYGGDQKLLPVHFQVALPFDDSADAGASASLEGMPDNNGDAPPPSKHSGSAFRLWGYIGAPGVSRSTREDQHLFVNRRPVENRGLNFAMLEGYHTALMKGRYPVCCLFVEIDPAGVDVNIHPAKREVKFHRESEVRRWVAQGVRETLLGFHSSQGSRQPTVESREPAVQMRVPVVEQPRLPQLTPVLAPQEPEAGKVAQAPLPMGFSPHPQPKPESPEPPPISIAHHLAPPTSDLSPLLSVPLRLVGVVGKLYVVLESDRGLVLLDQHAAHERILFEQMLNRLETKGQAPSQKLLLPETVELSAKDADFLRGHIPALTRLGVGLSEFGDRTFLLDALPPFVKVSAPRQFVIELVDQLKAAGQEINSHRLGEHTVAKTVCRHAVKANDPLAGPELENLVSDLRRCAMPYTCPHGRPTLIEMNFRELEKKFGRTQ